VILLARSANLPTGTCSLPSIISSFFNLRQIISVSTRPIFTISSPNERYLRKFSQSGPLFYSCKNIAMATDFGQNLQSDLYSTLLAFRNRFEYRNSAFEVIKGAIFATFCAILVMIGALTTKISQGVSVPFGTRRQKSTYHTKYLSKYLTELHQLFKVCRLMYADYNIEIIFAVVEETLLW